MKLKNDKRAKTAGLEEKQDKQAASIKGKTLALQWRCALWMQRKSESLPGKVKMVALILFCSMCAGLSLLRLAQGIGGTVTIDLNVSALRPISIPPAEDFDSGIGELDRIKKFRRYMDSLQVDPSGKKTYDSISSARPGLMDSIKMAEELYQLQTKN